MSGSGDGFDASRASASVEEFLTLLRRNRSAFAMKDEIYAANATWRETQNEILARRPLVIALAEELDPDLAERMRERSSAPWEWAAAEEAAAELLGLVREHVELGGAYGAGGPARQPELHAGIWRTVEKPWQEARFRDTVKDAGLFVFGVLLPGKLERSDVAGQVLVSEAFSLEPPTSAHPRLRLPGFVPDSEAWAAAHMAAEHLGLGCNLAVRSVVSRGVELQQWQAADILNELSIFARLVDAADATH